MEERWGEKGNPNQQNGDISHENIYFINSPIICWTVNDLGIKVDHKIGKNTFGLLFMIIKIYSCF